MFELVVVLLFLCHSGTIPLPLSPCRPHCPSFANFPQFPYVRSTDVLIAIVLWIVLWFFLFCVFLSSRGPPLALPPIPCPTPPPLVFMQLCFVVYFDYRLSLQPLPPIVYTQCLLIVLDCFLLLLLLAPLSSPAPMCVKRVSFELLGFCPPRLFKSESERCKLSKIPSPVCAIWQTQKFCRKCEHMGIVFLF
jgi:hypothetical protein